MSSFPKERGARVTVSPLILICRPCFGSDVRSLRSDSRSIAHLPAATASRQPFQFRGSSPEGLRNRVLFRINTDTPQRRGSQLLRSGATTARAGVVLPIQMSTGTRSITNHSARETAFSSFYRVALINYAHLQSQKKTPKP